MFLKLNVFMLSKDVRKEISKWKLNNIKWLKLNKMRNVENTKVSTCEIT